MNAKGGTYPGSSSEVALLLRGALLRTRLLYYNESQHMTAKNKDQDVAGNPGGLEGSSSRIRAVVGRVEPHDEDASIIEQIRAVQKSLKAKDRNEIAEAALTKYFRSELLKLILRQTKYRGRSRTHDFSPNPEIVIRGDRELKIMQKQKRKHGKFIR